MKITAVVVTHNRFELLKACIASLQSQHLPLSEIIVVNNETLQNLPFPESEPIGIEF